MQNRSKRNVLLTGRDGAILVFLWKWKLVTTMGLAVRFFPDSKPHAAYKRLHELKGEGWIERRTDGYGEICLWALTPKGYSLVKTELPELKEDGYKSENLEHDYLSTAFQLGEWLLDRPEGVELFSEQQLRRFHLDHYPDWIPRTDVHRPDGYWHVHLKEKMITIALEVELTAKVDSHYEIMAKHYDRHQQVFRVIWLTKNRTFAHYIQKRFMRAVGEKCLINDFVSLEDFREKGWEAPFVLGYEAGKTVNFLLGNKAGIPTGMPAESVATTFLLDAKRAPYRSAAYKPFQKPKNLYCIGSNPISQPLASANSGKEVSTENPIS